jgi:hypothetical protein
MGEKKGEGEIDGEEENGRQEKKVRRITIEIKKSERKK